MYGAAVSAESMARPVITVIQNDPDVPLDRFSRWLDGAEVRVVQAWTGEQLPAVEHLGNGLLVLGGEMNALDDVASPWLPPLRALLADAVATSVPTLGICLGAQLLALATGGRVVVSAPPGREAGIIPVRWRPEAAGDLLVGSLAAGSRPGERVVTPLPSMHADAVVDLPAGAVWLADSPRYPYQAFRIRSAWGVQFHPEVSPRTLEVWAEGCDDLDPAAVAAEALAADEQVAASGEAIARAFVTVVAAAAAASVAA